MHSLWDALCGRGRPNFLSQFSPRLKIPPADADIIHGPKGLCTMPFAEQRRRTSQNVLLPPRQPVIFTVTRPRSRLLSGPHLSSCFPAARSELRPVFSLCRAPRPCYGSSSSGETTVSSPSPVSSGETRPTRRRHYRPAEQTSIARRAPPSPAPR